MAKYLYGAAVQGIQGFIFQTNKLQEIVGASELVEEICTSKFASLIGKKGYYPELKKQLQEDKNCILHAAGNIKYIFEKEKDCKELVKVFPKEISNYAPGVTVSQAVVKMEGKFEKFEKAVNELEKRLRTQRNFQMRSSTIGMMGMLRSRQTGLPTIYRDGDDFLDAGTFAKLQYVWGRNGDKHVTKRKTTQNLCNKAFLPFGSKDEVGDSKIPYDIEDMTQKNDWVAIIHADGNGLGQIVQKVGTDEKEFKKFSNLLDKATTESAYNAYQWLLDEKKIMITEKEIIPIRPIVLGGDDFTVICRADIAIDYVTKFINEFERLTKEYLSETIKSHNVFTEGEKKDCLTACAGIAYIKSSYPFYYGYELAEALCSQAKKDAKNKASIKEGKELPMSCLMFHKVQDSFTEEWNEIAKRELTPQDNISFQFGPYYLSEKEDRWTINDLLDSSKRLNSKEGNAVKSHLRQWLSMLHDNPEMAEQKLLRLISLLDDPNNKEKKALLDLVKKVTDKNVKRAEDIIYPVYDMLAIHTINTQQTKNEEDK